MTGDLLAGLNPAQREAVTTTEGYVRVIAGAGSGKTRALTRRFAYLVCQLGIPPGNILCVTFTNKSANEMRRRIHSLTGDNDTGYINTFHGFCVTVLQEDSHAVQYPKSFLVLDNGDIDEMLKLIYEERGLTLRHMTFSKARDMIELRKTEKEPDYYLDLITMSPAELRRKYETAQSPQDIIFYGYLYQQKKCFGLDYNDLILFTLYIFRQDEQIRRKWQTRLEYIMIDEFQDIDRLQYRLMEALCRHHGNLFVVGDPDQTIYTWRGADVRFLLDFDRAFPQVKTILMMENYRSTPQILAVANALIACNSQRMDKRLLPNRPAGPKVTCCHCPTPQAEAQWIAGQIQQLHGQQVAYRDMAILYRTHYVTRNLEEALLAEGIPHTIYSGVPFFGRTEIKDTLCYLRLIAYKDDLSFRRAANVPKRNLGRRRMQFLQDYAADHACSLYEALAANAGEELFRGTKASALLALVEEFAATYAQRPISEVLTALLHRSGYEQMLRTQGSQERLDNLAELKQSVYAFEMSCGEETTLEHYLAHVALFTNADTGDSQDKVRLMTVHTAKGLEFPQVFLCGMNEGVFPTRKTVTRPAMEEERRLAFVAMTRAKDGLFLSEAQGRNFDGSLRYPSRFLLEIDSDLLHFPRQPPAELWAEARAYVAMQAGDLHAGASLAAGQRVRHSIFGLGTVLAVDMDRGAYVVRFDQMPTPRSITFRAKLEAL